MSKGVSFVKREDAKTVSLNWILPNFKSLHSLSKSGKEIRSDRFTLENGTNWLLELYPKGFTKDSTHEKGYASLFLYLVENAERLAKKVVAGNAFFAVTAAGSDLIRLLPYDKTTFDTSPECGGMGETNLVRATELLDPKGPFLHEDGSLHLLCRLDAPVVDFGKSPSGNANAFVVVSPLGKEYKVCHKILCT